MPSPGPVRRPPDYETAISTASRTASSTCGTREAVDDWRAAISSLDVLVNNAGANFPDGKDEWDPDGFSAALDLNVEGAMRLTARCRSVLAASTMSGGASVTNIVSMTAFRSTTIVPGYSAAKAALLALTRNLAVHWVGDGIRVNAVAPGLIDTPMTAPMKAFDGMVEAELRQGRHPTHGQPRRGGGGRAVPGQ